MTTPSATTWTLRLKHHKTTVLLHIDPLQTLSSVKSHLLTALQQTCPSNEISGRTLPSNADDFALAKPQDVHDVSLGWERIDGVSEGDESGKGKGKGRADWAKDTVKGAGVKDNGVLAFQWETEEEKREREKKEDAADEEDDLGLGEEKRWEWDVVIPSWEDAYGVENQGDVGALKEFNG